MSEDPDLATFYDEDAHESLRSWPKPYRFVLSFYTRLSTMTSSMKAPALDAIVNPSMSTVTPS